MRIVWILSISSLFSNPTGLQLISGQAFMDSTKPGLLEIQVSDMGVLEWEEFSIRPDECTRFIQPSSRSTVFNRVTGFKCSRIEGNLESNGNLILINHAGVLISKTAQIHSESFFASAFSLDSQAFANRKIINEGKIFAKSELYLVADTVENFGEIQASQIEISSSNISIRGILDALESAGHGGKISLLSDGNIEIFGSLFANSTGIGGEIFLHSDQSTIHPSGILSAEGKEQGGQIILKSERICNQFGDLIAEGGFIEISGKDEIHLGGNIRPGTLEKPGKLLLDPTDIDLGIGITTPPPFAYPPSDMLFNRPGPSAFLHIPDLVSQLENGVSVTIQTSPGLGGMGRIRILSPISWNQGTTLSLVADEQIHVLADVSNAGNGSLSLTASEGVLVQSSPLSSARIQLTSGNIQINALGLKLESISNPAIISSAEGNLTVALTGDMNLFSSMDGQANGTAIISANNIMINTAGAVSLQGGNGPNNRVGIHSLGLLQMNIGSTLSLSGGEGTASVAALSGNAAVDLDIGMGVTLNGSPGGEASIESKYGTLKIDVGTNMPSDLALSGNMQGGRISAMGDAAISSSNDLSAARGIFSSQGGILSLTAANEANFSQNSVISSPFGIQIQAGLILIDQSQIMGPTNLFAIESVVFQNNSELIAPKSLNIQASSLTFNLSTIKGIGSQTFQVGNTTFNGSTVLDFPTATFNGGSLTADTSSLYFSNLNPTLSGNFIVKNGTTILADTALNGNSAALTVSDSSLNAGQLSLVLSGPASLTNSYLSSNNLTNLSGTSLTMTDSTIESIQSTLALNFSGNGTFTDSSIISKSDASISFAVLMMANSTFQSSAQTITLTSPSTLSNESHIIANRTLTVMGTYLDLSSSHLTAININLSVSDRLSLNLNSDGNASRLFQINSGMLCELNLSSLRANQIIISSPSLQAIDSQITADRSFQLGVQNYSLMNSTISDPYSFLQN
ncbi:MAG: filamentous hemagglutinin N-terminal domain-containing protein [Parachlamydiales bacterium]|nr:filamentous hemagglutinin N-terminal domain-containing protein [Parachlamydiales bacterium]